MSNTVVVGITSGIAAFKALDVVKALKKKRLNVTVISTVKAAHMLPKKLFPKNFNYQQILKTKTVDHINLADQADVFVIAPATAHTIAKLAHGLAGNYLTTTILATTAPILICPSMNVNMWQNVSTQKKPKNSCQTRLLYPTPRRR